MDHPNRSKGKSITTSVPSIAIRFHTGDEELELYPSADDEEDEEKDDDHPPPPTPPSAPSRDPSPMKEYFRGLGKRSTSVDGAIMDVGGASDTWRIFHELKGKITKTVEEKLTEMKNERKASTSLANKRSRLRAGGVDNSSVSDSEDISETSNKDGENLLSPKDGVPVKKTSSGRVRAVNFPSPPTPETVSPVNVTPSTSQIDLDAPGTSEECKKKGKLGFRRKKGKKKLKDTAGGSSEETGTGTDSDYSLPVESGVEILEETVFEPELEDPDIITLDYRERPYEPHHPAELARRHSEIRRRAQRTWGDIYVEFREGIWQHRHEGAMLCAILVYMTAPVSPFINGLLIGILATVVYHSTFGLTSVGDSSAASAPVPFKVPDYMSMPVLKVPDCTNLDVSLTTTKCAGWMNELPDTVYDPDSYHISNTQTVYINLEGSTLRISHPKSKIQKRAAFDEKKYKLKFIHQRIYNIHGCKLELLPEGLTRKRTWSKKYPICLTLTSDSRLTDNDVELTSMYDEKEMEMNKNGVPSSSSLNALFVKDMEETSPSDLLIDTLQEENSEMSIPSIMVSEVEEEDNTSSNEMLKGDNTDDETFCHIDDSVLNERRLYLFARADRQKEDWYRRFAAAIKYTAPPADEDRSPDPSLPSEKVERVTAKGLEFSYDTSSAKYGDEHFIVDSARSMTSSNYLEFMNRFHLEIPRDKLSAKIANTLKLEREVDCDVMWLNAIAGHVLYDVLNNPDWLAKISERIQKKLDTIKRPYFLEDIRLMGVDLGKDIPMIHRASRPVLDEHGLWVDLDVSFEGNICLTLETKLNLMKLKKPSSEDLPEPEGEIKPVPSPPEKCKSPIFDSDLEDSAESSETEPEDQSKTSSDDTSIEKSKSAEMSPTKRAVASGGKGVLRMMNKIVSSKYFQQATENRYIKRAMEGVSNTVITLTVEIRGMTGILSVNLPPPPSDRLWYGFRGNPRVWLKAKPKFGDRHLNIKHVASWIEKKLVQEFQKKFVLPNMDDLVIPPMTTRLPD